MPKLYAPCLAESYHAMVRFGSNAEFLDWLQDFIRRGS